MKPIRILALVFAAAAVAAVPVSDAHAGRYGHGYGHRHHGHHFKAHGHGHHGLAIAGALITGAVIGHILTAPRYYPPAYPARVYAAPPPPAPYGSGLGNCRATTGVGTYQGYPAEFSGTICYNAYGQGFIINDSVRFLRYLD